MMVMVMGTLGGWVADLFIVAEWGRPLLWGFLATHINQPPFLFLHLPTLSSLSYSFSSSLSLSFSNSSFLTHTLPGQPPTCSSVMAITSKLTSLEGQYLVKQLVGRNLVHARFALRKVETGLSPCQSSIYGI